MAPLAVDYPPAADDPLDCYPQAPTQFGDGLLSACTVPDGWVLEVVQQPAYGTVAFQEGGLAWTFTMAATHPAVNTPDSFTYRLTDGSGGYSNVASVRLNLAVEQ